MPPTHNESDAEPHPPRWAQRLLTWLHPPETLEEVEGDLAELYAYWCGRAGKTQATLRYLLNVISVLPPFVRRRQRNQAYYQPSILSSAMLRNYLKIAWRNLAKNKVYSAINIGGLAVGMAVAILIGLWVWDELRFDKSFANYDRIAQVMQNQTSDGQVYTNYATPLPLEAELRSHYNNEFKHIVLSTWMGGHILEAGNTKFVKDGCFMQPDAPEMLSLTMLKGTKEGLGEPASILLAQSVAQSLFGDNDPMGKLVKIDDQSTVRVTGVYQDLPANSSFANLSFVAPWDLFVSGNDWIQKARQQWDNNSFQILVQLANQAQLSTVSAKVKDAKLRNVDQNVALSKPAIFLHPMSRWHLYSDWKNGVNTGGLIQYVWLFGIIGAFVLLLACINFTNLSTARSEKRAKEVGIRKAVGSVRSQLMGQFFTESFLTVLLAFGLSLLCVVLSLSVFRNVADKKILIPWSNPWFWLLGLGFTGLTGLIAGSYPAFYLSAFQPVKVLKGHFRAGRFAAVPRQVLVVIQFAVSITLIIGTIIVFRQIQFAKNRPVGYSRAGLVTLGVMQENVPSHQDIHAHFDAIRNELKNAGTITDMAESRSPLTGLWQTQNGFTWNGRNSSKQSDFGTVFVSHEFGKTACWQIKAGRDFSRQFATDSMGMVINEAAAKFMGLQQPVGETIQWEGKAWKVLGVVGNVLMESPYEPVKRTIYMIGNGAGNNVTFRINPNRSAAEALSQIKMVLKKQAPSVLFNYKFVDQEYAKKFGDEERIGNLASIFAILTIFISCLGLFGLASFMAEARTKEIGVRKVLGASVLNLWGLLSKDFVVLVVIAVGIATPIAYYFRSNWLQKYEYRTEMSWWIFAASGAGALLITLLTVSFQSIKAALMNPVKSLRSE